MMAKNQSGLLETHSKTVEVFATILAEKYKIRTVEKIANNDAIVIRSGSPRFVAKRII
jgi:hypothetical protein